MQDESQISVLMTRIDSGDGAAAAELLPLLYDELRRKAAYYLAHEAPGHTLQPTAIVHEAYMKLVAAGARNFQSRRHFFNAAAEAMRQILVDHARARGAIKRGGGAARMNLTDVAPPASDSDVDYVALDEALCELKEEDQRRHQVVMYRYFAGLQNAQIAELLDVSERTIERDWRLARMYLLAKLSH